MFFEQAQAQAGDMDEETLRRYGHSLVDWIMDYLFHIQPYSILSQVHPGDIQRQFSPEVPLHPESMEQILQDVQNIILPGITHWNSGRFMGYFGLGSSGPSILADMLDATLNVTRMLWRTSPAATELEQVTMNWLRQMLGLPDTFFGLLYHNSAVLHALISAREALQLDKRMVHDSGRLRLYVSQEAHASIDKAAIVMGLGRNGVRKIATDHMYRMNVSELVRAIRQDQQNGLIPFAVVATVGTTSTTSIDPVPHIFEVCQHFRLWLHVDAAYAGAAAIVPGKRWVLAGCDRADSISINPHKWLFTSFGCSAFYTRRPELLKAALSLTPDYLDNPERSSAVVPNLMDYDFSLPHRFPALKLWMVLRYFGREGLIARISEHCRLARLFVDWIDAAPDFERLAPVPLSVICFRAHPIGMENERVLNDLNERIVNRINGDGRFFLSHTYLRGKFTLRLSISNIRTTESLIYSVWDELKATLQYERSGVFQQPFNYKSRGPQLLMLPDHSSRKSKLI
jgi:aromatic-L-amino-acid decarboxylase